MRFRLLVVVMLVLAAVLAPPASSRWPDGIAWAAPQDPPARVGRLNYLRGSVSFAPRGVNEWAPAILNYPLTTGDSLWSDEQSRAEFHVASTVIRMDQSTALEILNLDDNTLQLRLSQGTIDVNLHEVVAGEHFEVDTPTAAVSLSQLGDYRLDVNVDGTSVQVTVRTGDAEITTSPYDFHVYPGQSTVISRSGTNLSYDIHPSAPPDAFDQWATARERQEQIALQEARYVPSTMTGFEDLTQFGTWQTVPGIGPVWIPAVQAGWAPFRFGRWVWAEPWGWTWIATEPWGFAPFHFGRWMLIGSEWAWVPGPVVVQPVFAPALVVFVVIGDFIGWFPLAPGEVFIPSFAASATFVQRINVAITNVTVINEIRPHHEFVFQQAPDAVTIVRKTVFTDAEPVMRSHIVVAGPMMGRARVIGTAAPVAPTVHSVLGGVAPGPMVVRPPLGAARTVVVRQTPPPVPVPFKVQEKFLTGTLGRPLDPETMARLREPGQVTPLSVKLLPTPDPRQPGAAARPTPTAQQVPMPPRKKPEPAPTLQPVPTPHPAQPKPTLHQAPVPPSIATLYPVLTAPRSGPALRPEPRARQSAPTSPPHGTQVTPVRPPMRTLVPTLSCDPRSKYYDRSRCPKKGS
jgi:hypothetical protein